MSGTSLPPAAPQPPGGLPAPRGLTAERGLVLCGKWAVRLQTLRSKRQSSCMWRERKKDGLQLQIALLPRSCTAIQLPGQMARTRARSLLQLITAQRTAAGSGGATACAST